MKGNELSEKTRHSRVVFMGTPRFAVPSLLALLDHTELVAVFTQPNRGYDRRGRLIENDAYAVARTMEVPAHAVEDINAEADLIRSYDPDFIVTCAFGQFISKEVLDIPRFGVLNVHASILPAYRGSAPIQRALMNGDTETGVTIMMTDEHMDSGDILATYRVPIGDDVYYDTLEDTLARAGAGLLLGAIDGYLTGKIKPEPQNAALATFAPRIRKSEGNLDFSKSATTVRNIVRGMGHGACEYRGQRLNIFVLDVVECPANSLPGEIVSLDGGLTVACGEGAVRIRELQLAGKNRQKFEAFNNGVRMQVGERLTHILTAEEALAEKKAAKKAEKAAKKAARAATEAAEKAARKAARRVELEAARAARNAAKEEEKRAAKEAAKKDNEEDPETK